MERYHPNIPSLAKQGLFRGEAAFSVQIFPWETEFMNNALWSPRGAQAGERTRTAGGTGCDGVKYIDKDKEEGTSRAIYAYLRCISCDGVEYVDKDKEWGDK